MIDESVPHSGLQRRKLTEEWASGEVSAERDCSLAGDVCDFSRCTCAPKTNNGLQGYLAQKKQLSP